MEKVFLRVYNREIESMVEGGQLDEAIAHCQHILKTFSMHVETYRLLGKAFLEARRYTDAADIFQRVLMAVPDDFVSHVGMSIICDDEGKQDNAIWHMERAYGVQPSNSAIQGELRRLYGRRDGVEPSKIRLSRDALANMYLQGELFNQAIAELRSVLADDPNRPDLQVMLMKAYYRSGHKVEAAELAANLLNKYPYCMDSLRVLIDVLPGTTRAENTQVYRHRLFLLDPYSNYASDSAFSSDQVPDSSINLERLDYRPSEVIKTQQPDWVTSLGIKLGTEKPAEPVPEWMQKSEISDEPLEAAPPVSDTKAVPAGNQTEATPDWMRSIDWLNSSGDAQVASPDSAETSPDSSIAKADIPDWLKSMAPKEVRESQEIESEAPKVILPMGEKGIPEWLKPMSPAAGMEAMTIDSKSGAESPSKGEAAPIEPEANISEQLSQPLAPTEAQPVESSPLPEPASSTPPVESVGERIEEPLAHVGSQALSSENIPVGSEPAVPAEGMGDASMSLKEPEQEPATSGQNIPEWLIPMTTIDSTHETVQEPAETVGTEGIAGDEIPDWLKSITSVEPVGENLAEPQASIESQPQGNDELPDWLKSLAPTTDVGKMDKVEAGSQPLEEQNLPEWLESEPVIEGTTPADVEAGKTSSEIPAVIETPETTRPETTPPVVEALPDLSVGKSSPPVGGETPTKTTEPPTTVEQPLAEQPITADTFTKAVEKPPVTEPGSPIESFHPSGEVKALNIEDDALGWLESLAAKQGANPEELLTNPEDRSVEMPDWLRQPGEEHGATPPISTQEPAPTTGTIPLETPGPSANAVSPITGPIMPETLPLEETPLQPPAEPVAQPVGQLASSAEDTMAWLERLSTAQEKPPSEPVSIAAENLETSSGQAQLLPEEQPVERVADELPPSVPSPVAEGLTSSEPASAPSGLISSEPTLATSDLIPPEPTPAPSTLISTEPAQAPNDLIPPGPITTPEKLSLQKTEPLSSEPTLLTPVEAQAEPIPSTPTPPSDEDITITSWMSKLDVEEALNKPSDEQAEEEKPLSSAEELPDWLKDIESPVKSLDTPKVGDDLPEWLRHPISSAETESIPESEVTERVDRNLPAEGQAVPTMPEEWVPAELKPETSQEQVTIPQSSLPSESQITLRPEATPETISVSEPVSLSVQPSADQPNQIQSGNLSAIPAQDKDAELLAAAQAALGQESLDDSMRQYLKLIKKGRMLDEVIHDLREAIYRHPVDVIIWQTLGDAYMRTNRLQDALDAYNKAEELLR